MSLQYVAAKKWRATALASTLTLLTSTMPMTAQPAAKKPQQPSTKIPIQHVIIIIGENRTFDHLFATYQPKPGNTVNNLLSEGIINADGSPGPNYSLAQQYSADITGSPVFELSPTTGKLPTACCRHR
jgi:phospholipase C